MFKGSILIAEDDTILRELYVKKFGNEGYEIRAAEDGEQAIAAIKERAPDLMICDIRMPGVDGFQVLKEFPKESRKFPIIMLTNFDQEDLKKRALEMGADDYCMKTDFTMNGLVEKVESMRHL